MREIVRTSEEIEAQIKKLADQSVFTPEGVEDDERELYRWYCRGGISMGRWVLGEEMGDPHHETETLKK